MGRVQSSVLDTQAVRSTIPQQEEGKSEEPTPIIFTKAYVKVYVVFVQSLHHPTLGSESGYLQLIQAILSDGIAVEHTVNLIDINMGSTILITFERDISRLSGKNGMREGWRWEANRRIVRV